MKAKKVNETYNFHKTGSVKGSLEIGGINLEEIRKQHKDEYEENYRKFYEDAIKTIMNY